MCIAELLFTTAAYESFSTLEKIKSACANLPDDELVYVNFPGATVFYVYNILTYKPEGQFNRINTEMYDLLMPQIIAGAQAGDPEWIDLGSKIQEVRAANLQVVDKMVESGRSKLYSS
jgi:hypothetical protein